MPALTWTEDHNIECVGVVLDQAEDVPVEDNDDEMFAVHYVVPAPEVLAIYLKKRERD